MRVAMLFWHFPHALHSALVVAAPHTDPRQVRSVPALGTASSGIDSNAPMASCVTVSALNEAEARLQTAIWEEKSERSEAEGRMRSPRASCITYYPIG